jgi:hypothetical protein
MFKTDSITNEPWYQIKDKDDALKALVNVIYTLTDKDERLQEHLKYLKMYSGKPQSSNMGFYTPARNNISKPGKGRDKYRVNYNVVKSVIDTLVSKACLNPPKATLITEGGCITDRLKAIKLDKAIFMTMKAAGVFKEWNVFVKHALIHGDCDVKVYACPKEKKVKFTRVLPPDIYTQELDAMYGDPNCIYQTSFMHKDVLFAKYPEMKEVRDTKYKSESAKLNSQFISQGKIENIEGFRDYVEIVEAWKVQVDDVKGRHIIACRYGILTDEEYTREELPFARLSWSKSHFGYYSPGIPEQLESKQAQINMILAFMTEAADKSKSPILFYQQQGSNDKGMVIKNNEIAQAVGFTGNVAPQWSTFSGYPATEFERLQWLIRSCYEEVGLNQMSSTGKNILGSGASKVALQEFTNIESDRFQEFGKSLDSFMIDLCTQTINALKDLKDLGVDCIKGEYKGVYEEIELDALNIDPDEFEFTIVTSSMLPMSSAARKDFSSDLYNSGIIDKAKYLELLQLPDLEQFNKLELAPRQAIENQVEKLIETKDEKYLMPNENMDLIYGLKFVISLLCQYSLTEDEEDQKAVELLEAFKANLTVEVSKLAQTQQAMLAQAQQGALPQSAIGRPANINQNVSG